MSGIGALIVDDEPLARAVLREYAAAHDDVRIVGECGNAFEALDAIAAERPDLVFLDIQMPRLDGFEMLELLERPPLVVFVTAHDECALKAFEIHACDYLLKPFGQERFDEALARARGRLGRNWQVNAEEYARLQDQARDPDAPLTRIAVRRAGAVEVLAVDDVELLEARDDHVGLHLRDGPMRLKQRTLSWFEQRLDPGRFVRVHRSYIVSLARLRAVEAVTKDSHEAVLESGRRVPVSRAGYKRLRERLG